MLRLYVQAFLLQSRLRNGTEAYVTGYVDCETINFRRAHHLFCNALCDIVSYLHGVKLSHSRHVMAGLVVARQIVVECLMTPGHNSRHSVSCNTSPDGKESPEQTQGPRKMGVSLVVQDGYFNLPSIRVCVYV